MRGAHPAGRSTASPRRPGAAATATDIGLSVVVASAVLAASALDASLGPRDTAQWLAVALGLVAVTVRSASPGGALAVAAAGTVAQLLSGLEVGPAYLCLPLVVYVSASRGGRKVVVAGGIAAGLAAPLIGWYLVTTDSWAVQLGDPLFALPAPAVVVLGLLVLVVVQLFPWVLGLLRRHQRRSQTEAMQLVVAERDAERARAAAAESSARTRLARDVHDVVGHSLAVIVAQADSVPYLPPDDVRRAAGDIAQVARSALGEIRQLLATIDLPHDLAAPQPEPDVHELIARLRGLGWAVDERADGTPRELDAGTAAVLAAVVRELVTNILKHARRDATVDVAWTWADQLTLRVVNTSAAEGERGLPGRGLQGARLRAAEAGGDLRVESTDSPDGDRFAVVVTLPLTEDRP